MARVRCARCGKKMPRQNWDAHAAQCAPAPNPGESFADYKKRISPPQPPPCGAAVNLECDCPTCQGL